jgi:non-specific serine/threonine protein kinase
MDIKIDRVRHYANPKAFRRGIQLYRQKRVDLTEFEDDLFEATVLEESRSFQVKARKAGHKILAGCSCGFVYWGSCEHIVAAMLTAREYYENKLERPVRLNKVNHWQDFFRKIGSAANSIASAKKLKPQWQIVYLIDFNSDYWTLTPQKAYQRKDEQLGRMIPVNDLDPESSDIGFMPNDPIVIKYLRHREGRMFSPYAHRYYPHHDYLSNSFKYGAKSGKLLELLTESMIFLTSEENKKDNITFHPGNCRIEFELTAQDDGYNFSPFIVLDNCREPFDQKYQVLTEKPIWLLQDHTLIRVENFNSSDLLIPFTKNQLTISIPKNELPQFIESIFPALALSTDLKLPANLPVYEAKQIEKKRIYLKEEQDRLVIYLKFVYGNCEVNYSNPLAELFLMSADGSAIAKIQRDPEAEKLIEQQLIQTGLKPMLRGGFRITESKALPWMFDQLPQLENAGFEIFGREQLRKWQVRNGAPNIRLAVSSQIDWFDLNLQIDIEGVALSIKELKKAILHHQRFVKLNDGSMAKLSEAWFKKFQHLFNFGEVQGEKVHLPRFHVTMIDVLFDEAVSMQADEQYHQSVARLRQFSGIQSQALPQNIDGILRPYQKAGFDWLCFLQEYSFGGCLADDMGLGKTLQALTLLLSEKEKGNRIPSLIVCPTSVVFNWEKEVQKFTPDLKVLVHTGLDRRRGTNAFSDYDIVLTTYGLIRRDIAFLKNFKFFYIILDESQKIKNPLSQTAKAARVLQAHHRLALTGTPVENNTVELWSQFSFLNPGLLGSLNYFRETFANPIEKKQDNETADLLRKLVFPFILRRTKERVERELPEKVEQLFYCGMNPAQEKLYTYWRDFYRALILNKIDEVGIDKSRMNILEGLVKLRQIACHPYLVDQSISEDSAKFESLKELTESILAENHKVLIFSQFVRMLSLIRKHLEEREISYEYLDGHTIHREKCVSRFQTNESVRVFLISLKAGGTGLNLTAADYVILYDPWWNPAVEIQATDRAHRIGQDKKVFVYRLITKGSVEDKMLELQQKKMDLVSNLISTDGSFFKSLSRKDIEVLFS